MISTKTDTRKLAETIAEAVVKAQLKVVNGQWHDACLATVVEYHLTKAEQEREKQ